MVRKRILPFTTVRRESDSVNLWPSLDETQSKCIEKLLSDSSEKDQGFIYNQVGIGADAIALRSSTCKMQVKDSNGSVVGEVLGKTTEYFSKCFYHFQFLTNCCLFCHRGR